MQNENKMEAKLNLVRFPLNTTKYYSLNTEQDWVKDLLIELNEKADDFTPEENLSKTSISVELEVSKKNKEACGDYILIKGQLKAKFLTRCVRTLQIMEDELELEIKACFLEEFYQEEEAYADQDEIFQDDDMYELYFTEKKFADVSEMIHEQIYLNINQYPIKDEETPLGWANETSDTKQ